ncbi:MAG: hypothetical protein IJR47_00145 [Clostridia bacterium]|nr:hypothetical protein [Clostridia bacterium]
MSRYDDIINLPHHISAARPQMPISDRAAQFSPFAALTGFEAAIKETGRLTDKRIELDENMLNILNIKMQCIVENLDKEPDITFTYFEPDKTKDGGEYLTITGKVKKIDDYARQIILQTGEKLNIDDVVNISGDIFAGLV